MFFISVVYVLRERGQIFFYFNYMLVAWYWGQRKNKEKTYTLLYFKQETKESFLYYWPWLNDMLRKVVHSVLFNKYIRKKLLFNLLCIEFLHVFNQPHSFLINKFDRRFLSDNTLQQIDRCFLAARCNKFYISFFLARRCNKFHKCFLSSNTLQQIWWILKV